MSKQDNKKHDEAFESLIEQFISKDSQFNDNYQTREQKARDCEITKLLRQYVSAYSAKIEIQQDYRKVLLIICSSIICLFSIAFLALLLYLGFCDNKTDISSIVSLISICITFLASILGLMQIITKYCFPENDEEYITKIVEAIQQNDLSHKLANMNSMSNVQDKEPEEQTTDNT